MELVHNGQRRRIDPRTEPRVGDVLGSCVEAGLRVLSRVTLDGVEIGEEELAELRQLATEGEGELAVESRPRSALACDGLESAASYAEAIRAAFLRVAELLRVGQVKRASGLQAEVLDALGVLLFAIGRATDAIGAAAEPLRGLERELEEPFAELVGAHERGDWIGVADLLEHEVAPSLCAWPERLEQVRASALGSARNLEN